MTRQEYVIGLFVRGRLRSLEQGAYIADVSRVTVRQWLVARQIDWRACHRHYLTRLKRRGLALEDGKLSRKPSKGDLQAKADEAEGRWTQWD